MFNGQVLGVAQKDSLLNYYGSFKATVLLIISKIIIYIYKLLICLEVVVKG